MKDLLIRGGHLYDPASELDAVGDLLIQDGQITGLGEVRSSGAEEIVEAKGLLVTPGLMDLHVHLREPGQGHKETIASGTSAAAAGGFATVVCEPNTSPPRDRPEWMVELLEIAERTAKVRVLPKCCITENQQGRAVTNLAALRAAGAVAASDDGFSVADKAVMREAFMLAKQVWMPLTLHVDGPEMMARDIGLAAEVNWPVHFSHVSLEEEVALIAAAQKRGLRVTGEATPHHLVLVADKVSSTDANYKTNPPLRTRKDCEALQQALRQGVISVIASDHAPHSAEEKSLPYADAPPGVVGLETTVAVIWTELVYKGLLEVNTAVRAMTVGPASILGRKTPKLGIGGIADVTLIDQEHEWVVDPGRFHSFGGNCPFAGWRVRGKATGTIVAGRVAMLEGMVF